MLSDIIDVNLIDQAKHLKVIAQFAVGHNNIDTDYARKKGIFVCNTPDVLTHATAELAFALLLCCARKISPAIDNVTTNQWRGWEPLGFLGKSLKDTKVGILGAGRIGQEFAKMCKGAFNSQIYYCGPSDKVDFEKDLGAKKLELEQMLKTCDVISVHTPLTSKTRHILNEKTLKLCKDEAILINTARGEIIEQEALVKELERGRFFGIGLDVTTPEPLPADTRLNSFENVVITPHIGSATQKARHEMGSLCMANIIAVLGNDDPITLISS